MASRNRIDAAGLPSSMDQSISCCVREARMRSLSLLVNVPDDRRVVVQLPEDIPPGEVRLSLFIHEGSDGKAKPGQPRTLKLPELHFESWPENFPLRRSELYDDEGRV